MGGHGVLLHHAPLLRLQPVLPKLLLQRVLRQRAVLAKKQQINTISNTISNPVGNTISNTIGNSIGNSIKKNPDFPDTPFTNISIILKLFLKQG